MRKDLVPQMFGVCALIAASDHRRAEKGGGKPLLQPLPLQLKTSQRLKRPAPAFPLHLCFSPFGSYSLKTRTFRNNCIYE